MKKLILALLFAPSIALAVPPQGPLATCPLGTLLSAVALNGAVGTRTFTIPDSCGGDGQGYAVLALTFNHSAHASSTDIGFTCTASPDAQTTKAVIQYCDVAAATGICTLRDTSWIKAISGVKVFEARVGIVGLKGIECIVTSTAAGGGDLLTVKGFLVSQ